jgi:hypothetical protein
MRRKPAVIRCQVCRIIRDIHFFVTPKGSVRPLCGMHRERRPDGSQMKGSHHEQENV